jgi:CzcA family heavy metal efflux pump
VSLTGIFQRHRAAIYLGAVLLTAAGVNAVRTLPAGAYPEAVFPRIVVIALGSGFEPRDMVVAVARPLEEAVSGVIDLRRIRSRTVRGSAELSLDFRPGADMQYALQQVQGRVAAAQSSLPPGLRLEVERLTPSVFPMLQYELTGGNPVVLRDLAQYVIRPRLARLPDVGDVDVAGGFVREVSVVLDPERLITQHLGVPDVANAITATNQLTAAGRVDREYRQFGVLVSGLATTPEALGQTVVRNVGDRLVRVADLGSVGYGVQDLFQLARGNGQPAALINISRQPAGNTLRVEKAVAEAVAAIRPLLPAGVKLELVYNQGSLVRSSIASVRDAMVVGGILAMVVLLLFLGRPAIALIAGLSIPLTIAGTFVGLALFGDSFNLMSLGGLAVAIGLIIDDAVVVVENVERNLALHQDEPHAEVIRRATDEIFPPVAGSTLTTVVVFTPLGLLTGVVGQFFRSFSLALAIAVLLSLVIAVALIPLLAQEWHRRHADEEKVAKPPRWQLSLGPVERVHERALAGLLDHRALALLLAAGAVVLLVFLSRSIGTGFLPEMDEGGFILDYWTPTGSSLAETDALVGRIEKILRADPGVQSFTRRTGSELGFFATSPNRGDMTVLLKPRKQRHASVYEVMNRLRDRIATEVPSVRTEFMQILADLIGDLAASGKPVELKLFHPDLATAEKASRAVAKEVESIPGLVDLFNGVQGYLPELRVDFDPVRVARLGLSIEEASRQAQAALFGAGAGALREPDRQVPIRVRIVDSLRLDPNVVARLPIIGPNGWVPLSALGRVHDTADAAELTRENLRPYVAVTGGVDPSTSSLGAVVKQLRSRLRHVQLPPGMLEIGGQAASQREAFRQLLLVFALGAGAVLLVMVTQFGNFRGPLAIMLAAPLGLTGALVALALTGVPFNVSSFMGLILLIGLIVKNGIILLDAAHGFHDSGMSPREALLQAGRLRLRPILMTTLCTLAGLFPLALGLGSGAELQRPLAIAVLGGLTLSTLVTLLLLPVGLEAMGALRKPEEVAPAGNLPP